MLELLNADDAIARFDNKIVKHHQNVVLCEAESEIWECERKKERVKTNKSALTKWICTKIASAAIQAAAIAKHHAETQ